MRTRTLLGEGATNCHDGFTDFFAASLASFWLLVQNGGPGAYAGPPEPMQRTLLGIWTWFAFAAISSVGYVLCLALFLLTFAFDRNRVVTGSAIRFTGRMMCAAVPAWKFSYQKPVPLPLPPRAVCVSNHCSNIDPFLLAHLPFEMKYLAKSGLFRIPAVGWGMKIAGDISLVRGSPRSIKAAMAKAAQYVARGMPVLIFPEGTRSTSGELLPFKDGAFRLAIQQQAAVVPIALAGTTAALKKGDWRPGPAHGTALVGDPLPTEGLEMKDLPELKRQARSAIEQLRQRLKQKRNEALP